MQLRFRLRRSHSLDIGVGIGRDQTLAANGASDVVFGQTHSRVSLQPQQIRLALVSSRERQVLADARSSPRVERRPHGAEEERSQESHAPVIRQKAEDLDGVLRRGKEIVVLVEEMHRGGG